MTFVCEKTMEEESKLDSLKKEYKYGYDEIIKLGAKLKDDDMFSKSKECERCNATEYYSNEIEMTIHRLAILCTRHEELKRLISKEEEAN